MISIDYDHAVLAQEALGTEIRRNVAVFLKYRRRKSHQPLAKFSLNLAKRYGAARNAIRRAMKPHEPSGKDLLSLNTNHSCC